MTKLFDVTTEDEISLDPILYGLRSELLASCFQPTVAVLPRSLRTILRALGNSVGFISRIGSDPLGSIALERLCEQNVDLSCVRASGSSKSAVG
jgi:hypothetical protein